MLRENIEDFNEVVAGQTEPELVFEATLNGVPDIGFHEAAPLDEPSGPTLAQVLDQKEGPANFAPPDPVATPDPAATADLIAENGRMLARIAFLLLVLILLVNVPITSWGASLLQIVPQNVTPVALANGMVLQAEQGDRYLLDNRQLRPFSSQEAYENYGRQQGWQVQTIADRIISQYGRGLPIYHLVQCEAEATIYTLAEGVKQPFTPPADTPFPFSDAAWDQIELIDCQQLADIPLADIPEG